MMTESIQGSPAYNSNAFGSRRASDAKLFVNTHQLIEILETKISSDKIERDLLFSLSDKLRKDRDNRFSLQEFIATCTETLVCMKEKVSITWAQLQQILAEKREIEKNIEEAKKTEKQRRSEALYNDLLRIKVCEVRSLPIAPGEKVFVRISCDDIVFNTRLHDYLSGNFEEAFYEFFVKTGLEKLRIEVIVSKTSSRAHDEVLGEFLLPVNSADIETEQDGWYLLNTRSGSSRCGEVRLSLKLVSLRVEFLKYSTEEIDHKVFNQTQEVEGLEKSFKNLALVASVLKDPNFFNSMSSTSPMPSEKKFSSLNYDASEDRRQSASGARRSTEKKRMLPPLAIQSIGNRMEQSAGRGSERKQDSVNQNKMRSPSPVKDGITVSDFNSAPRLEMSSGPRSSLAGLYNILMNNNTVTNNSVNNNALRMSETKGSLSSKRNYNSVDCETEGTLESFRTQGGSAKDQTSWKRENLRLNGMIKSLQEENRVLLKEVQKLRDTEQKVSECKDKMSVLIGELNRIQDIVKEKNDEIAYLKQHNERNSGMDMKEIQGRIQKLVDENQRLRDIASKSHNESVYYKKQCELYGGNKDKIDGLVKEIEVLRTVNQNLNLEQLDRTDYIEQLQKENKCLKDNNQTFSNELAKRDAMVNQLKKEVGAYRDRANNRSSSKGNRLYTDENCERLEMRRNVIFQPLQPWNFMSNQKGQ